MPSQFFFLSLRLSLALRFSASGYCSLRFGGAPKNAVLVVFGVEIGVKNDSALSFDGGEQEVGLLELALALVSA